MVTPAARREASGHLHLVYRVSQRRAQAGARHQGTADPATGSKPALADGFFA
jgi:hypothetical protein